MKNIIVKIKEASGKCVLKPHYDNESGVLEITSDYRRDWIYGIDIDGNVIIDIDKSYKIANVDLLVPKKLWEVSSEFPCFAESKTFIDLLFDLEMIRYKSFNLPMKILCNMKKDQVMILIDSINNSTIKYGLSNNCYVLINDETKLCGFLITLN